MQVRSGKFIEIDIYTQGGWRVNQFKKGNSPGNDTVREYNLHLARSVALHGSAVIDVEADFLRQSHSATDILSKISIFAMPTGFSCVNRADERDIIIGVVIPAAPKNNKKRSSSQSAVKVT